MEWSGMSISETPGIAGIEPDRLVEITASACNVIDSAILRMRADEEAMSVSWSVLRRDLADRVLLLARDGYIASDSVTEALGSEFAEGPLLEAGLRLGWLERPERGQPGQFAETDLGQGTLDAIKHCLGDEP